MIRRRTAHGLTLRAQTSRLGAYLIGPLHSAPAVGAAALIHRCAVITPHFAGAATAGQGLVVLVQEPVPAP